MSSKKAKPATPPAPADAPPESTAPKLGTEAEIDAYLRQFTPTQLEQALMTLPDDMQRALAAASARSSFLEFTRQAWQYVPQVEAQFIDNWHMDAMCAHGEAVARGEIEALNINIPPGYSKSVIWSVLLPAWIWTWWPRAQFMCASYAKDLAVRDSGRCRQVIESEWYQKTFARPAGWRLRRDLNRKDWFANTAGGERFSTGIGGVGRRAHVIIIDDALSVEDSSSETKRADVIRWLSQTISQRFIAGQAKRLINVQQRLHEQDPSGWMIKDGAQNLCLPTEFVPKRRARTFHVVNGLRKLFWQDPRSTPGELLFPALYPRARVDEAKRRLTPAGFAAQEQQDPQPPGGHLFKIENWRYWKHDGDPDVQERPDDAYKGPAVVLPARFDRSMLSVDATFKKTTDGSYVAIQIWARNAGRFFCLARIKRRMGFGETKREIRKLLLTEFGRLCRRKVVEDKANGSAIVDDLKDEFPGFEAVDPRGGKEARANAAEPYQSAGSCYLPDGAPWLGDFTHVLGAFPKGDEDDDVDAFTQAIIDMEQAAITTARLWASAKV